MSQSSCKSTSYFHNFFQGYKEEMDESPKVAHIAEKASHKTSNFDYIEKRAIVKVGRIYKRNFGTQQKHQNDEKLEKKFGKKNPHTGNECLFATSPSSLSTTPTTFRSFMAVVFTYLMCVNLCSAIETHQLNLGSNTDLEKDAALIEPVQHLPNTFHVIEDSETDCVKITMDEGVFHFKSRGMESRTCGLYMVSDPNKLIVVTIEHLNVRCQQGGLISVVDGWEMNGAVFPSYEDHEKTPQNRFHDLCVDSKQHPMRRIYSSSQNAALIQYRIPVFGQGFSVRVEHIPNPRPCNILVQDVEGIFTLENHGRNVNCSLMTIFDSKIRLMYMSTGLHHRSSVKTFSHSPRLQRGIYHKCSKMGLRDYVQIGGSTSLDTSKAETVEDLCGYQPHPSSKYTTIFCGMTSIRLVSSGKYSNRVVAEVLRATIDDLESANYICDFGLGLEDY